MIRVELKKHSKYLLYTVAVMFVLTSCTDLTESVNDQVTNETFFKKPQDFVSAMGDAYGSLSYVGGTGGFPVIQEVPTDEMITPQRGQDWYDGGNYIRMERHQWKYDMSHINNAWQQLYTGINNANRLIFQFNQAIESGSADEEQAQIFIDELRALRGYFYYWLLDTFGNVPIVTSFEGAPENPSQPSNNFQEGRKQVFEFVEKELKESLPQLSTDVNETYGRMNQYVVHMTLAKLYLNAEAYIGEPHWDEALTHINAIINSGKYSLSSNYFNNFAVDNSGSPEIILAYPYDKVFATGFVMPTMGSLHYGMQAKFNMQNQPWNGFSSKKEFYESYIDSDVNPGPQGEVWGTQPTETEQGLERVQGTQDRRLDNFQVGPQFTAGGARITDGASKAEFDPNGPPLTLTPHINMLEPNACRQCGIRIGKYEIPMGTLNDLSNDFVIYRYADVLLMKAEVLWRQGSSQALTYINMVRNRAGVDDFTSIDGEKILAERGREMFYSLLRRQDMIRFEGEQGETDFNDPWEFKPDASEAYRNVFPIPRNQLESNPNLTQNPGYQSN